MIERNGIKALSDNTYDYYELQQDFGVLKKGAIFVHDKNDTMYGSLSEGCLKLCWTPNGNCYSGLCANTVFLHCKFKEDKLFFRKVSIGLKDKEKILNSIKILENELIKLKQKLGFN